MRSRWPGWKFDTPIERISPSSPQRDERLPRVDVAVLGRERPVDQVQVEIVEAELVAGSRRTRAAGVVAVGVVVQLGGDEQLVARDAGRGDRGADARFVAVHRRGVDRAVAGLERGADGPFGLVGRNLEHAEAELRHVVAAVEGDATVGTSAMSRPTYPAAVASRPVRLVIARCSVDYVGRLTAHLPLGHPAADGQGRRLGARALRRRLVQAAELDEPAVHAGRGATACWTVTNKAGEQLLVTLEEVLHDSAHELGVDPGLVKDGVEAHLQKLLAEQIQTLGDGLPAGAPRVPDADRAGRHHGARPERASPSRSRSSGAARSTGSSS